MLSLDHAYPPVESSSVDWMLESYGYSLPEERIAQRPLIPRHEAKLLVYRQSEDRVEHTTFLQLAQYLPTSSLLVTNQSKVFPCRLLGVKETGGKAEVFLLKTELGKRGYPTLIRTSGTKKVGDVFFFAEGIEAKIESVQTRGVFEVSFNRELKVILETVGNMPIPPYIRGGQADQRDLRDYQTSFAVETGSVAAPTAGLHFTPEVFDSLEKKGIERANVTLHVGVGTFAPVKSTSILDHQMHAEVFSLSEASWRKMERASFKTLVGTTCLRALESFLALENPQLEQFHQTELFLYPGKTVRACDALVTNFHLPHSTLLMLVSALIGRSKTLELYREALREGYRFLSYGDAMLILRERNTRCE